MKTYKPITKKIIIDILTDVEHYNQSPLNLIINGYNIDENITCRKICVKKGRIEYFYYKDSPESMERFKMLLNQILNRNEKSKYSNSIKNV
jgi:hypothetical protein